MTRDFTSVADLADGEILRLLDAAAAFERDVRRHSGARLGTLMATLFLEPSTRTRLSFEAAMHRLGGRVITSADPKSSSSSKGETLADTVRMVDGYADLIVLRHPAAGAARLAADRARRPVINAGDGGREHPSQTLVDLYTLREHFERLDGLKVALYGDLKYGRTTHSLAEALVRFGAEVYGVCEPGLELPEATANVATEDYGATTGEATLTGAEDLFGPAPLRVRTLARRGAPDRLAAKDFRFDVLYATRVQAERLPEGASARRLLPTVDRRLLDHPLWSEAVVLHPLPRVGEIDPAVDEDSRALYFRQAEAGVPVRMALLDAVLDGDRPWTRAAPPPRPDPGFRCGKTGCITAQEPADPLVSADGRRCGYCDRA
ncbi:MAG TPA: aspartate carbamoyltransferase [Planctomycetota bacterium]|nr:aspartate carbamoyltransferase [Planctomycetota bacterium]